ncbi:MAG: DEAD/DEAH box helicase [Kiritimatiellia bacterium]
MIDISAIERLDDKEQLVLYVFVFVGAGRNLSDRFIEKVMERSGVQFPKRWSVNVLCEPLCNAKILDCVSKSRYAGYTSYRLADRFLPSAIARLLEISIERNWWVIFGYNDAQPSLDRSRVEKSRLEMLDFGWDCTEMAFQMRQLLSGALLNPFVEGFFQESSVQWKVCAILPKLVFFDAPEPLRLKFEKGTPLSVFFKLLAVLLTRNASVGWLLEQIANAAREKRIAFSAPQYCEFVSYCILCGHTGWIDGVKDGGKGSGDFAQLPDVLRAGGLATANNICSRVDKAVDFGDLDYPASNILALLVSLFARPASTRAAKYIREIAPNPNRQRYYNGEGENNEIDARSSIYYSVCDCLNREARISAVTEKEFEFTRTLGVLVQTMLNGMNKKDSARIVKRMLTSAEQIVGVGYPTLAGAYLSVFGWALPEDEKEKADALVKRIAEKGGVWFRPFFGVASSWQRIVDVLNERLPKKVAKKFGDSGKVKSGRIIWGIEEDAGGLMKLQPLFRGPRGAVDGADDKRLTTNALLGGKYDDCMTDADKAVVGVLRKTKYVGAKDGWGISANLYATLCGLDNMVKLEPDQKAKSYVEKPLRFVRRDIPLSAKSKKDGGLTLTVPEWAMQRNRLCFVLKAQPDCYEFYPIDKDKAPLLDVFREYGDRGTIKLPKEAMAKVRPLLGRIAALIPLQGDLANAAGESGLKRIAGDATPLVRLSMEEDTLAIALRVRPVAEAKSIVCEPGAGQAERTVALADGAAVLVRDLAEERLRAEEVETVLADCESWREGRLDWAVDDPGAALAALSAVRGLGEKAHVEWQPGKKIGLAKPCRRLALGATLGADRWLSVNGDCELDDGRVVTLLKLLSRFGKRIGRFVPIDENGYVELSRPLLRTLEALETAGRESKGKLLVPPAALPMLDTTFAEGGAELALPKTMQIETERIRCALSGRYAAPERLKGVLRPYQEAGYEWLARLAACGLGSCLADDMGLGKTVQIIALLLARGAEGASLVIAPTSVAGNWRGEIRRFAPTLHPIIAGDGDDGNWLKADARDVVIVSYGLLVSRSAKFLSREWNGVILDEAQAIKNADTERAKAVKKLSAKFRVAATGTPVENRLTDLWSVFDFLNPGLLGTEDAFIEKFTDGGRATAALKNLVRPLVLRRLKRDVLDDLPEKTEITLSVPLEGDERAGYEACRVAALDTLEKGGKENRISILAELMRLRRYCCHPSLVLPEVAAGAKLEALLELLRDLKGANHRVLVFSQFTDFLKIVEARVKQEGFSSQYLDGATPPQERERRVAAFQRGEGDLFLLSLKAGGTGLNLTAANYVVLLDPWWNPAVEDQAADRAHRIGQRNPVTVYRLIAADTVEERVLELHREKKDLARDILDGTGSTALTPEVLMKLFT